jgi:hypothetical protein
VAIFAKLRCTTGINGTGGNLATIFASVVDTGGKFATGVNDTPGKFAPGVNDAGGKLSPVSGTPEANLQICIMAIISGCRHLKVNLKAKI